MRAIGKYIVIDRVSEEVKSSSGLFLSGDDVNSLRYKKGVVVNPGTDVSVVKEGDVIYYDKSAGHDIVINGDKRSIILERDVVVVL
jgi:co-chaperonin GroES (HSP10)